MYNTVLLGDGYDFDSIAFESETQTSKTTKIINGDITQAAPRQCQRPALVVSPFLIFAVLQDQLGGH